MRMYESVSRAIIDEMERGAVPWVRPWRTNRYSKTSVMPANAVTGRSYSGINVPILWASADANGYPQRTQTRARATTRRVVRAGRIRAIRQEATLGRSDVGANLSRHRRRARSHASRGRGARGSAARHALSRVGGRRPHDLGKTHLARPRAIFPEHCPQRRHRSRSKLWVRSCSL